MQTGSANHDFGSYNHPSQLQHMWVEADLEAHRCCQPPDSAPEIEDQAEERTGHAAGVAGY